MSKENYDLVEKARMDCIGGMGCPAIYELAQENRVSNPDNCIAGIGCPNIQLRGEYYLIIGEQVNAKEFGLAEKVNAGEVMIRVPRKLIDKVEATK